jgi:hypothetical protein
MLRSAFYGKWMIARQMDACVVKTKGLSFVGRVAATLSRGKMPLVELLDLARLSR